MSGVSPSRRILFAVCALTRQTGSDDRFVALPAVRSVGPFYARVRARVVVRRFIFVEAAAVRHDEPVLENKFGAPVRSYITESGPRCRGLCCAKVTKTPGAGHVRFSLPGAGGQ